MPVFHFSKTLKRSMLSLLLLSLAVPPTAFPATKGEEAYAASQEEATHAVTAAAAFTASASASAATAIAATSVATVATAATATSVAKAVEVSLPAIPEVMPYLAAAARASHTPVYSDRERTRLLANLTAGEEYPVLSQDSSSIKLQLLDGKTGYVDKALMTLRPVKRYVLGWNAFADRETYHQQNRVSDQLNVVSPRWYFLEKEDGPLSVSDDAAYVASSHTLGQEVWPLFGNRFDSDMTDRFLKSADSRKAAIAAITASLKRTMADGINLDFENIQPDNKALFVTFVQELADALHPLGKKISVDVSRTNPDPYWSGSFDRRKLGEIADFIILMGYDEHWEGSPTAGSVSSLPWLREGVRLLLNDVPGQKVILGLPFYTRDWAIPSSGSVSSEYMPITQAAELVKRLGLRKAWDSATEQNRVSYTSSGVAHQIWLEDLDSMKRRTALIQDYALRGAAAWYMGEETADIWSAFQRISPAKPLTSTVSFSDLKGHPAMDSVLALARDRVITGTAPNRFEPDRPVSRAEFAVLLSRLYIGGTPAGTNAASGFSDVRSGSWYASSARFLTDLGVTTGYPGRRFLPDAPISREEMAVMISRLMTLTASFAPPSTAKQEELLRPFLDQGSLTWSRRSVAIALDQGIVKGQTSSHFGAERSATRAEAAVMLARLQSWLEIHTDSDY
ncbi:S-layer homology domain-containing protein [Gorillibacterium timonense]|uniref:S-layer homology domain-containing protein n=1 Tax=Gorillibacterium timonense TaxID=1689269 RepID=UPI00071CDD8C|nr:S-layer homology domain-containing protein [Gorillibacterium timonense]